MTRIMNGKVKQSTLVRIGAEEAVAKDNLGFLPTASVSCLLKERCDERNEVVENEDDAGIMLMPFTENLEYYDDMIPLLPSL